MQTDTATLTQILSQKGYQLIRFLGHGGFSQVYLCYSIKYQREFAIKRTLKERVTDYEYKNLSFLNHTNIIRLYEAFEDETYHYLVIDYCSNGSLRDKPKLTSEKFVYYARQILEAVYYCHSNQIAHRDIKPENIFLDEYDHVKLADFGMAKTFGKDALSSEKCGTYKYSSPEMFTCHEIDPFKSDIWSLGVTFFFMATGSFPFESSTREKLELMITKGEINFAKFTINHKIAFLLKKMLQKSAENRPSAKELLDFDIFKRLKEKNLVKINGRLIASNHRYNSCINIETFPSDLKTNKAVDDDGNQKNQTADLNSYKKISRFNHLLRLNSNILPSKIY